MAFADDFRPGGQIRLKVVNYGGVQGFRGTICCFVFKKGEKQLYILTCGHVLNPPDTEGANTVVYDSKDNCVGIISQDNVLFDEKALEGMDAGLAKVTQSREMKAENFNVAGTKLPLTRSMNMYRVPGENWDVMVRGARTADNWADPMPKPGKMNDAGYCGRFKIVPTKSLIKKGFKWAGGD